MQASHQLTPTHSLQVIPHPIYRAVHRVLGFSTVLLTLVCFARTLAERVPFDIQTGGAKPMLRQFATQAKREIVFTTEAVASVRTNAVKSEMTPQEAINLMHADIGLVGAQDSKTGAFVIRHETETETKNGARAAPAGVRPIPPGEAKTETLVFNPFAVRTGRDNGFVASSSLSGGVIVRRQAADRSGESSLAAKAPSCRRSL